ncbi:hypothetical protein SAMN06265379_10894 [Saccharicrinis carchari]|uniref:Uncharacterized protein n=1 Tax=Saccharicrinis carchari TaxID=1168039 RepID=A0A521EBD7_SACCC|nr:hypothetical protein [Saccharicrinis carchari]SMO81258.1 hypothetical protein SAMN06265379_10894 [Saccharicrinis carchari]
MLSSEEFILEQCEKELNLFPKSDSEISQHLMELGYLPAHLVNTFSQKHEDVAIEKFEYDLIDSGIFTLSEIVHQRKLGRESYVKYFLRRLTDIDEGITFESLPQRGQTTLASRVIHYRLDLFGLWVQPIEIPFGMASMMSIMQIAGFGRCNALEAVNHLANVQEFTNHLLQQHDKENFVLSFYSAQASEKLKRKLDRRRRFGAQLEDDFGNSNTYIDLLQKHIFKNNQNNIDYVFLRRESNNPLKQFLVRLIQVHQWQEGFYDGLLDSNLGDLSLDSILQSIRSHNEADKKDVKIHRVLTYLGNGYFMFNALFFLTEYAIEENMVDETQIWDSLTSDIKNAQPEQQQIFQDNLQDLRVGIQKQQSSISQKKGILKRLYYGIKKLLKKAFRFAKKMFKWVVNKASRVWGFLKRFFANFFDRLKVGLAAFIDGIRFLIGRKVIFTGNRFRFISTWCRLDADVSTIAIDASANMIKEHTKEVRYRWAALAFSLAVTGLVLKSLSRALNVLSWPLALFSIVNSFKVVSEQYKKLELVTN